MQFYRIISYFIAEKDPTQYPITLSIKEETVFTPYDNLWEELAVGGGKPFCIIVQNIEIDECGKFILCDEEIKTFSPAMPSVEDNSPFGRFDYEDIVEVIDGNRLTLGIIVHTPLQAHINTVVDKPHLLYRYAVLLYKPDGRIVLEDVPPTHLLRTHTLVADSQISALRTASEDMCIQE